MRWLMPSWISPASRRRSVSCQQHDLLGEPLHRLLTLGQPGVQTGVLDGPGHQTRHRAQQLDIGLGELRGGRGYAR